MVPLLVGWNSAEIPGSAFMMGASYNDSNYVNKIKAAYPANYDEVLQLYPHQNQKEIELSATALASDRFISYSTWKWFDLHRKNSEQPVYRYLFSHIRPLAKAENRPDKEEQNISKPIGAGHASEIEYCMGNLYLVDDFAWTKDDYKVSETMQNYFANFIKTGNPNGSNQPDWPASQSTDLHPPVMVLDANTRVEKAPNDGRYMFLDKMYKNNN